MYDDRFTFHLVGFKYDLLTNGDIYVHNTIGTTFPGAFENLYDWTAPFNDMPNETWDLTTDSCSQKKYRQCRKKHARKSIYSYNGWLFKIT